MANQGNIRFGVKFDVDKSNLTSLQHEFAQLSKLTLPDLKLKGIDITEEELKSIQEEAKKIQKIFEKSYNFKLGTVDTDKLKKNLNDSNMTLAQFEAKIKKLGPAGISSIGSINNSLYKTNKILKETHPLLEKMEKTFANTIRWTIASTAINSFTGSIQKAWGFTKELDNSLNSIRIVTEKSAEQMESFAIQANKAAKALGVSTKSYANAALIYYQQGLSDEEVATRTNITSKVANVTGQSAQAASEQLTAIWNGYKITQGEAELAIDKISAVAASTAADMEELATGMSRVASAANIMGVDLDSLTAQLATIVSVTREAPESIGTALKTVYARMSDIESGLDEETSLGEYTKQMAQLGINALDSQGNLRDMGAVVEEIGNNWNNLSRNQQVALAQTIAGTRQYSRMMALFDNWDMYKQAKSTSIGAAGTLDKQNEIALDTIDKKLQQLSTTTESLFITLTDSNAFKGLIDFFTSMVSLTTQVIENLGGARTLLIGLGALAIKSLSGSFGQFIGSTVKNRAINKAAKEQQGQSINEIEALNKKTIRSTSAYKSFTPDIEKVRAERKSLQKQYDSFIPDDLGYSEGEENNTIEYEEQIKLKKEILTLEAKEKELQKERRKAGQEALEAERTAARERAVMSEKEQRAYRLLSQEEYERRQERAEQIKEEQKKIAELEQQKITIQKQAEEEIQRIKEEAIFQEIEARKQANATILSDYEKLVAKIKELQDKIDKDEADESFAQKIVKHQLGEDREINFNNTISTENARIDLLNKQAELESHEKNIKSIGKSVSSVEDISSVDMDEITSEVDYIKDLDISKQVEARLNEAVETIAKILEKATNGEDITDADLEKLNSAKATIGAQGKDAIKSEVKDNKKAVDVLEKSAVYERRERKKQNKEKQDEVKEEEKRQKKKVRDAKKANDALEKDDSDLRKEIAKNIEEQAKDETTALGETIKAKEEASQEELENIDEISQEERQRLNELNEDRALEDKKLEAQDAAEAAAKLAASIAQVGAGISMIASLPSIMNNDDLSTLEKVMGVTSTLVPAIWSIGSGLGNIVANAPKVIAGLAGVTTAELATVPASEIAKKAINGVKRALKSLGTALMTPPIVIITAILAAIVVALAAVTVAVDLMTKSMNINNEKAKEAAATAKYLEEQYSNMKAAYDELKQSILDYQGMQDALHALTEGTEEWNDALRENNAFVTDLIQKYPQLVDWVEKNDKTGELSFKEGGLEAAELAMAKSVDTAAAFAASANIASAQASEKAQAETIRNNSDYFDFGSFMKGYGKLLSITGLIWGISEDISNQRFGASLMDETSIDDIQEIAEKLAKESVAPDNLAQYIADTLGVDEDSAQVKALMRNSSAIEGLSKDIEENNKLLDYQNEEVMRNVLASNSDYSNSEYQAQIVDITADIFDKEYQDALDKYEDKGHGGNGVTDAEIQDLYADMMVKTGQWQSVEKSENIDGNAGKYTYVDAAGVRHENSEISDSVARTAYASYIAQMKASNASLVKALNITFNKINKQLGRTIGDAIIKGGLINGRKEGNLNALTVAEIQELQDKLQKGELDLTQTELDNLGYDSLEEYKTAIQDTIDLYYENEEKLLASFDKQDKNWTKNWNMLTQETKETYSNLNKELNTEAKDALDNIFKGLSVDQVPEFFKIIEETDWTEPDAYFQLISELSRLTGLSKDKIEPLAHGVLELSDSFGKFDIQNMQEKYKTLSSIISNLSSIGDTISAEEYKALGPAFEDYFTLMADGTYALTVAASDFAKIANEALWETSKNKFEEVNAAINKKEQELYDLEHFDGFVEKRIGNITIQIPKTSEAYKNWSKEYNKQKQVEFDAAKMQQVGIINGVLEDSGLTQSQVSKKDANEDVKVDNVAVQQMMNFIEQYGADSDINELYTWHEKDGHKFYIPGDADGKDDVMDAGALDKLIEIYNNVKNREKVGINKGQKDIAFEAYKNSLRTDITNMSEQDRSETLKNMLAAASNEEQIATVEKLNEEYGILTDADFDKKKSLIVEEQASIDLLHEEQQALEELEREYDKLEDAIDSVYGEDKLKYLSQQSQNLQEQIANLKEQNRLLKERQTLWFTDEKLEGGKTFEQLFGDFKDENGEGLKFTDFLDKNGNIDYNAVIAATQEFINTEAVGSINRTNLENAQKLLIEHMNTYEENAEQIINNSASIAEKGLEVLKTNFATIEAKFSPTLDVQNMKREYNNFLREISLEEEDFGGLGESYKQDFDSLKIDILAYEQKLAELDSKQIITAEELEYMRANNIALTEDMILQEDYIAAKQELQINLQDTLVSLKEQMTQINELQISQLDEISEAYDTQISYLEDINSLYDHLISINELLYGDKARARTANLYKTQIDNQNQVLAKRKEEYQYFLTQSQDARLDDDTRAHAREQAAATAQEIAAISAELAQAITDDFNASIEFMISNLFTGLQDAKEEWNWLKGESDRVYNDLTKSFEIAKFENEINKAINSTTSINAQRQLNKLREEELKALEKKEQLTKYDFDRAQARFELLQAQIALEEAQANKTKMQLVRGADGTYGYEYVADTDAVSEKTQAVLDVQQKVLDLDADEYNSQLDGILETTEEFIDAFMQVFKDGIAEPWEKEWLQSIVDSLNAQIKDATPIIENLRETVKDSGLLLGKSLGELTDEEMAQLFPQFDSRMYKVIKDLIEDGGISQASLENLISQAEIEGKDWQKDLNNLAKYLGLQDEDGELIGGLIKTTTTSGGIYDLMNEDQITILNEGKTAMEGLAEKGNAVKLAYEKMYQPIVDVTNALYEFNRQATLGIMPTKLAFSSSADSLSYKEGLQTKLGSMSIVDREKLYRSWGLSDFVLRQEGFDPKEDLANFDTLLAQIIDNEDWKNLLRFLPYIQFDTGGYTGEWGGDGRLALLHEKELVLNQEDTSNILDAIELVRKLQFSLDASLSSRLGDMMQSYETSMAAWEMAKDWIIEQTVQIQAEFPGVTDQNEIVEAFNILTNMATQKVAENSNL